MGLEKTGESIAAQLAVKRIEVNRRRDQLIVKIAGGLDVYNAKRSRKNRAQRLAIPYVRQLAQSHRNGSAPVDEVFDLERLTIALVMAEAFGSLRPLRRLSTQVREKPNGLSTRPNSLSRRGAPSKLQRLRRPPNRLLCSRDSLLADRSHRRRWQPRRRRRRPAC